MKTEGEAGSSSNNEDKTVVIRNGQPDPMEVHVKMNVGRVQWKSEDGQEYEILFKKADPWGFHETPNTATDDEHGFRVPKTDSSWFRVKAKGEYHYRVATERTRGVRKPPNGPAVIGEG